MISIHLDGVRRAEVTALDDGRAAILLLSGSRNRVSIPMRSEEQARVVAKSINAGAETMGEAAARLLAGMDTLKNKTGGA